MDEYFNAPDMTVAQDIAKERRARAAKLVDQAMQSGGQMVGRVYVPKNPLANFAEGFAGGMQREMADRDLKAEQDKYRRAEQAWLAEKPDELARTGDPQLFERWMQKGQQFKDRAALEMQFANRADDRRFRHDEATLTREQRAEEARLNREAKQQDRAEQREFQAGQNALYKRTAEQMAAAARQPRERFQLVTAEDGSVHRINMDTGERSPVEGIKKATPATKLNAAQQKALDDADVFLGHIDNALDLLGSNPNALGLKTMITDTALQRIDPEGVATRAAVGGLAAEKVHQLSGAAVSAAEFKRLQPYLPAAGDSTETVRKKLQGLRKEAERIRGNHAKGPTTPSAETPKPAAASGTWDADKEARYQAWKKANGK